MKAATRSDSHSFPSAIGSSMDNDLTSLSWLQNAACLLPAISAVPDGAPNAAAAFALSTSRIRERFDWCCDSMILYEETFAAIDCEMQTLKEWRKEINEIGLQYH